MAVVPLCAMFAVVLVGLAGAQSTRDPGPPCVQGDMLGSESFLSQTEFVDDHDSDSFYMPTDPRYTAQCCGHIYMWKQFTTDIMDIGISVWYEEDDMFRRTEAVSTTVHSGSSLKTTMLAPHNQVNVMKGGRVGWIVEYNSSLTYGDDSNVPPVLQVRFGEDQNATFDDAHELTNRQYAFVAYLKENEPPTLHNLNVTITLQAGQEENTTVNKVYVADMKSDDPFTIRRLDNEQQYFAVDEYVQGSFSAYWVAFPFPILVNLVLMPPPGIYNISLLILDVCNVPVGNGNVTIIVEEQGERRPLRISGLPTTLLLGESLEEKISDFVPEECDSMLTNTTGLKDVDRVASNTTLEHKAQLVSYELICLDQAGTEKRGLYFVYNWRQRLMTDRNEYLDSLEAQTTIARRLVYRIGTIPLIGSTLYYLRLLRRHTGEDIIAVTQSPPTTTDVIVYSTSDSSIIVADDGIDLLDTVRLSIESRGERGLIEVVVVDGRNEPQFAEKFVSITLYEDQIQPRKPVVRYTATDRDKHDTLRYSIDCGTMSGYLRMDPVSGDITLPESFDLDLVLLGETKILFRCEVLVTDRSRQSSKGGFVVLMVDVDDSRPQFIQEVYQFCVDPASPAGTKIGQISAIDIDRTEAFRTTTYRIEQVYGDRNGNSSGLASVDYFIIDEVTGALYTGAGIIPREYGSNFTMNVSAVDTNGKAWDFTTVVLHVQKCSVWSSGVLLADLMTSEVVMYSASAATLVIDIVLFVALIGQRLFLKTRKIHQEDKESQREDEGFEEETNKYKTD